MNGIIGAIVGNSVGQSYEIIKTRDYNFNMIYDKGNAADDSVAILAVADWLMSTAHTNDDLIDKLHFWCNKFNYGMYNYGNAVKFKDWIRNKERGPYNSYGNGSAMRVIPVGFYADTLENCLYLAKKSAEITHNHPEGIKGAQAIAAAIFLIRQGKSKKSIKKYIEETFGYNLHKSYSELKKSHVFECTCQRSVPTALICWLESKSYEDAIRKAISLGGDADTEGAIAGALAAADPKTPVDDELVHDVIRFFSMDFLDLLKKWHKEVEGNYEQNVK